MFRCTCALVNARPPPEGTCSLPREALLPPPPRFRDGLEEVPKTPYRGLLVHFTHLAIHFRESVRGLLVRRWRWSLARGRLALQIDAMAADSSLRHHRRR